MAMSTGLSCLMSSLFSIILFAGMRLVKEWLCSSKSLTILGGFLGSILFVLILTALNNAENLIFGKGFQAEIFPEVTVSIFVAALVAGFVHPVSGTTCIPFSLYALYRINQLSAEQYGAAKQSAVIGGPKKKI
ncbi:hypothetical protein CRM22_006934 [Opisthorchis felineus]|uniref:Uncharacterized protein n=1 Tax=Opisthorchis felineus TaxID=147828 RepID=A0A4S2LIX8_OPIFE|nr:hypothetical protein CRM22_006934 [Opisthorchis felineus]